jgi:hypothetical protein
LNFILRGKDGDKFFIPHYVLKVIHYATRRLLKTIEACKLKTKMCSQCDVQVVSELVDCNFSEGGTLQLDIVNVSINLVQIVFFNMAVNIHILVFWDITPTVPCRSSFRASYSYPH